MAAPFKTGLDYFPLDIDIEHNEKIYLIESKHGSVAFTVIIKLFARVYGKGYFYKWSDREAAIFSRQTAIPLEDVNSILKDCLDEGIFNDELFKLYNILTSKEIQKRFLIACGRRKTVEMEKMYTLIPGNDYRNLVIVNNNPGSAELMSTKTPQSKVKESKVKKRKVKKEKSADGLFDVFWKAYPKKVGKQQALKAWNKLKPSEELLAAILQAIKNQQAWRKNAKPGDFRPEWPHPSTWLSNARWEDEIPVANKSKSPPKMIPCPKCRSPVKENAFACLKCGTRLEDPVDRVEDEGVDRLCTTLADKMSRGP